MTDDKLVEAYRDVIFGEGFGKTKNNNVVLCRCGKFSTTECEDCGKPLCDDCTREGNLCMKCHISKTAKTVNKKLGIN